MAWAVGKLGPQVDAALIVLIFAGMTLLPLLIGSVLYCRFRSEDEVGLSRQYRLDSAIALLTLVPLLLWTAFFLIRSQSRLLVIAVALGSVPLSALLSGILAFAGRGKGRAAVLVTLFVMVLSVIGVFSWAFYTKANPIAPGF